ncbi:hypothetical protein [Candidatus Formimonas warabiya]|uniref:YhhN-like protein n=1 Tax=Formimonas warabiya TaxID=1761012 RepID=A0A3G1KXC4_FORW1|nr:hypothetical protein [Candidatus Formimonas warabiya]ATW27091.1 hypothetical protein DCMF_22140 [Candidatus Formimonas warabiya]
MSTNKRRYLLFLMILFLAVTGWYLYWDFSGFFASCGLYQPYPGNLIKRINIMLATMMVWSAGKDRYDLTDNRRMKVIFLILWGGEVSFLLGKTFAGIGFFALCQFLLIRRNGRGLIRSLKCAGEKQKTKLKLLGFMIVCIPLVAVAFCYPLLRGHLFFIALFYEVLLSISLWVGLANYLIGLFPKKNAKMVALGMMCFYWSDFFMALGHIIEVNLVWLFVNSAIWILYTWALLFLALSCYKYHST